MKYFLNVEGGQRCVRLLRHQRRPAGRSGQSSRRFTFGGHHVAAFAALHRRQLLPRYLEK